MNILILLNRKKDQDLSYTKEVSNYLLSNGFNIYFESELFNEINMGRELILDEINKIDFCLVLGGDGTILNKAYEYSKYNLKYLGINLGRVGCLSEGKPNEYKRIISSIINNEYKVEKRIALSGYIYRNGKVIKDILSFNEVSLYRGKSLKMLHLKIKLNGMHDTSFYADGLNVSTPTGSSAYSLSSGGPLLISTANSFVLTPICPQLRTITSLVVDGDDEISISLVKELKSEYLPSLQIDGRESFDIEVNDEIILKKSIVTLNIVKVNLNEPLYEPIFKVTNTR